MAKTYCAVSLGVAGRQPAAAGSPLTSVRKSVGLSEPFRDPAIDTGVAQRAQSFGILIGMAAGAGAPSALPNMGCKRDRELRVSQGATGSSLADQIRRL